MDKALKKYEEARKTGDVPSPPPPTEDREGLPLRVRVRRNPSGGGEIGAEMLRGRKLWLWTIKRALNRTMNVLYKHKWTILRPPEGITWFTSDNPVIRLNMSSPTKYNFDGGWNSRGTCIFLPLGPNTYSTRKSENVRRSVVSACSKNTRIWFASSPEHAWRMIFAREQETDVPVFHPRIVNPEEVQPERDQWSTWNEQQVLAEQEMDETGDS